MTKRDYFALLVRSAYDGTFPSVNKYGGVAYRANGKADCPQRSPAGLLIPDRLYDVKMEPEWEQDDYSSLDCMVLPKGVTLYAVDCAEHWHFALWLEKRDVFLASVDRDGSILRSYMNDADLWEGRKEQYLRRVNEYADSRREFYRKQLWDAKNFIECLVDDEYAFYEYREALLNGEFEPFPRQEEITYEDSGEPM